MFISCPLFCFLGKDFLLGSWCPFLFLLYIVIQKRNSVDEMGNELCRSGWCKSGDRGLHEADGGDLSDFYLALEENVGKEMEMNKKMSQLKGTQGGQGQAHRDFHGLIPTNSQKLKEDQHEYHVELVNTPPVATAVDRKTSKAGFGKEERVEKGMSDGKRKAAAAAQQLITVEERKLKTCATQIECNPDTLMEAILQMKTQCSSDEAFSKILIKYPRAMELLASTRLETEVNIESVLRLYECAGKHTQAGRVGVRLAYQQKELPKRLEQLEAACAIFQKDRSQSGKIYVEATKEQIRLLQEQQYLEKVTGCSDLVDKTVLETIGILITLLPTHKGSLKLAMDISKKFSVHPKQFWYSVVKRFDETGQMDLLFTFASTSNPPVGYIPIIKVFLRAQRNDLIQKIYSLVKDPAQKQKISELIEKNSRE